MDVEIGMKVDLFFMMICQKQPRGWKLWLECLFGLGFTGFDASYWHAESEQSPLTKKQGRLTTGAHLHQNSHKVASQTENFQ